MSYLYLISSVFLVSSTSIIGGFFNRKNTDKKGSEAFYNLLILSSVFLSWLIIFLCDGTFDWSVLPYSVGFGVCYAVAAIATIYALKTGPVLLTSLMLQLSLIAVSIWGFFAGWQTPQWWTWVGLAMVAIALWLCLKKDESDDGEMATFSWKWLGYVALMFFGNAGCSIVQKTQQMAYNQQYGSFLMVVAIFIATLACVVLYLRSDRSDNPEMLKTSWFLPVSAGIANVFLNIVVMKMAVSELSPSLIYPVMAVGGLILTTVFSACVLKEKMNRWQWIGIVIGMAATAVLSI